MDWEVIATAIAPAAAALGAAIPLVAYRLSKRVQVSVESELGSLASDEALVALREKLTSGGDTQQAADPAVELRVVKLSEAIQENQTYKVLAKYSAQGLAQSKISFLTSLTFAALGFLVILIGIAAGSIKDDRDFVWVPVVSGGIAEAVAALFFTINAGTQKVMVSFFDKLRADKRVEDAMRIAETLSDQAMSERLQVLLALKFAEVRDLGQLLEQIAGDRPTTEVGLAVHGDEPR